MKATVKIKNIYKEIINLGAVLPGGVSKIYNVCGKQGCRCKDPKNPKKHGPYNLMSYTINKKSSSKFVKDKDLEMVKQMQENHQYLKTLIQELSVAYAELFKSTDMQTVKDTVDKIKLDLSTEELSSEKRLIYAKNQADKKAVMWNSKAREKTQELNTLRAKFRKMEQSRNMWKEKYNNCQKSIDNKKNSR